MRAHEKKRVILDAFLCVVCAFDLALLHRLFVLLTHTREHVCCVFGVLLRLFLTLPAPKQAKIT